MAEKLYRIGDAAEILGLKSYVLRFWESEFPALRPVRSGKGQRRYTERDLALLKKIRYLLYDQGLTIEGARRVLSGKSDLSVSGTSASGSHDCPLSVSVPSAVADTVSSRASCAADSNEAILRQVAAELRALQQLLQHD